MLPLDAILSVLTPEQKAQLAAQLVGSATAATAVLDPPTPAAPAAPAAPSSSYYDMGEAIEATFKARLTPSDKARDPSYAAKYDHIWCKGHYQVKGPKGGNYFVGRCVLGVKKHQQVKGILRVSTERFVALMNGQTIDGWFRPDGAKDSVLLGELSQYKAQ